MKGQIYKNLSGKYVVIADKKEYICTSKGTLKRDVGGLLCGDLVEFDGKTISKVYDRKNRFFRPNVANIDAVAILVSPSPKPDFLLIDKLIVNAISQNAEIYLIVNKIDLDDDFYNEIVKEYSQVVTDIIKISALNKQGTETVKHRLSGKLCCFAGQSAVGKTTLINAIFNTEERTGELSKKTERGKHTTTNSQIYENDGVKVIDSPGFAVIEAEVKADELCEYYPEFMKLNGQCKFRQCSHVSEPDCAVKNMVESGKISKTRYERYKQIYLELMEKGNIYGKN
ncbi:MAG: ribosome small subunit-dependent GTPase A [Clostridia bacterium]|nr:ribosome small subunit-dependent GTPase A [Clostridia bacterium]